MTARLTVQLRPAALVTPAVRRKPRSVPAAVVVAGGVGGAVTMTPRSGALSGRPIVVTQMTIRSLPPSPPPALPTAMSRPHRPRRVTSQPVAAAVAVAAALLMGRARAATPRLNGVRGGQARSRPGPGVGPPRAAAAGENPAAPAMPTAAVGRRPFRGWVRAVTRMTKAWNFSAWTRPCPRVRQRGIPAMTNCWPRAGSTASGMFPAGSRRSALSSPATWTAASSRPSGPWKKPSVAPARECGRSTARLGNTRKR